MKTFFIAAATFALSTAPVMAHDSYHYVTDSPLPIHDTQGNGYVTQYEIISITPKPHLAGYQELNLNPAPAAPVASGVHGGEALVIYPYQN